MIPPNEFAWQRNAFRHVALAILAVASLILSGTSKCRGAAGDPSGNDGKPLMRMRAVLDALGANCWVPRSNQQKIELLTADIAALGPGVSKVEARKVAKCIQTSMDELRREYRVVWPPVLHNRFIYYGYRRRGYCYQWTDDLYLRLKSLKIRTLAVGCAIAYEDEALENNSLVLGIPGRPLGEAILIDGWRYSGRLVWHRLGKDHYPWKLYKPKHLRANEKRTPQARRG